jgi:hypothetical protein
MKVFCYMGHNPRNKSGVSWKLWKVERSGRDLTVWWGPATLRRRKPVPANTLQTQSWRCRTEEEARAQERRRIEEKLGKGYERMPRRRPAGSSR